MPVMLREQVSAELHRLNHLEVIERVERAECMLRTVIVRMKDCTIRLCVDLRELNKAVVVDGFHQPRTEELLHQLVEATRFSKLDLASAYHQAELMPDSRELTTFVTHDGCFRFRLVCF